MPYRAMYIWSDGTEPTPLLRSKTNVLKDGEEPGIWGFDGSSTNQAPGGDSDVVLRPVKSVPDPIRGGDDILVLSECLTPDFEPHPTNTRAACVEAYAKYADFNPIFGLEQEYTFITMMDPTASQFYGPPPGFPLGGYPAPQGPYYCSVGANRAFGRVVVDKHSQACIDAGPGDRGHQRRGDARAVGIPDRAAAAGRSVRPDPDRPLADRADRRGPRPRGDLASEAGNG